MVVHTTESHRPRQYDPNEEFDVTWRPATSLTHIVRGLPATAWLPKLSRKRELDSGRIETEAARRRRLHVEMYGDSPMF